MRILETILTAVLLQYFFLFTAPSTAHIISVKLQSDNRHVIPFLDFEFSKVGFVSFNLSSVTVASASSPPDPSRIGFFFQSRKVDDQQPFKLQEHTTICALDFELNSVLFTFQNLSDDPPTSFNKSFPVIHPGMKSLYFVNCNNKLSQVTMEGRIELYNIDDGTTKKYLSAGLTQLPFLYSIFSFVYLSFLGVWIFVCFKNRLSFCMTHLLMGGLLLVNLVHFLCVAADLRYVNVMGNAHRLDGVFYIFQIIRAVVISSVIMLIGGGWIFGKPVLERKEKMVMIIGILLQILVNLDPVLPWEAAFPYNKDHRSLLFIDVICCYAFFFPIAESIMSLKEISETDLNAERKLIKLKTFATLVIVYVIFTRVFAPSLSPRWEEYVAKETSILMFCMVIFYMFRPVHKMRMMATPNEESGLSLFKSISCFYSPV